MVFTWLSTPSMAFSRAATALERAESVLDIDALVDEAVKGLEEVELRHE